MAAALDETKAHTEQAQANYQKSLAFKEPPWVRIVVASIES